MLKTIMNVSAALPTMLYERAIRITWEMAGLSCETNAPEIEPWYVGPTDTSSASMIGPTILCMGTVGDVFATCERVSVAARGAIVAAERGADATSAAVEMAGVREQVAAHILPDYLRRGLDRRAMEGAEGFLGRREDEVGGLRRARDHLGALAHPLLRGARRRGQREDVRGHHLHELQLLDEKLLDREFVELRRTNRT